MLRTFELPTVNPACFYPHVPRTSSILKYWLPVLLWMLIIFSASSDAMSSGHTSRLIAPILRWIKPDISDAAVGRIVFAVRKAAHVTEYAILALLFWRAWRAMVISKAAELKNTGAIEPENAASRSPTSDAPSAPPRPWRWPHALIAIGVAFVYAASDEIHQYFVPSREARFGDVMLDTSGAVLALLALWAFGRWRRRW